MIQMCDQVCGQVEAMAKGLQVCPLGRMVHVDGSDIDRLGQRIEHESLAFGIEPHLLNLFEQDCLFACVDVSVGLCGSLSLLHLGGRVGSGLQSGAKPGSLSPTDRPARQAADRCLDKEAFPEMTDIARLLLLISVLALGGCAAKPQPEHDACALFDDNGGFFNNWSRHTRQVEREFGVPAHVVMATIWKESSFQARARPARKRHLGFIPGKRPSNAYGYPQALDSTWDWYRQDTGRSGAKRNSFKDAAHFVGWYHDQSHRRNGVAKSDAYNLYLNYYLGHGGYARGAAQSNAFARDAAQRVAARAALYSHQMSQCRA